MKNVSKDDVKVFWEVIEKENEKIKSHVGCLTILPRLNSLNHEPGDSLGQLDILTYIKNMSKIS